VTRLKQVEDLTEDDLLDMIDTRRSKGWIREVHCGILREYVGLPPRPRDGDRVAGGSLTPTG